MISNRERRFAAGRDHELADYFVSTDRLRRHCTEDGWSRTVDEDYYPILEYQAPKAFFLGSVASVIRSHDEREMPVKGDALYLMRYLSERQVALSREEHQNFNAFRGTYGSRKMLKEAVHNWVHRFPEDRQALLALAQVQKLTGSWNWL